MRNIAIIGGGFTGLAAAKKLADEGHRVTVYESGRDLGGLAGCFELGGTPIEKTYHHLFRTDTAILTLIDDLGLNECLGWHDSSMAVYRNRRVWPFMSPLDLLRFSPCSRLGRIRTGLVALYLKKTKNWRKLAATPAIEWMRKTCGESAVNALWGPMLRGKFFDSADKVSMAWLWARLHVRSNSREPGEGEKLGYIDGGFIRIIHELEQRILAAGGQVHRATPVTRIVHDGATPVLEVGTQSLPYDAVLFTGSNNAFQRLLPDDESMNQYRERLKRINYLGAVCLVFTSNQSIGKHYWVNINEPDAPFLVFIHHTRLIPPSRYQGKQVYYIGAYLPQDQGRFLMEEDELKAEWYSYLKTIHPEFEPSLVEESHLFRLRDAQHIAELGYEERILPYETPMPGVFLANFAQIFPEDRGTNFAVNEGNQVAARIISSFHLA